MVGDKVPETPRKTDGDADDANEDDDDDAVAACCCCCCCWSGIAPNGGVAAGVEAVGIGVDADADEDDGAPGTEAGAAKIGGCIITD